MAQEITMPKTKLPMSQATIEDLKYWCGRKAKALEDGETDARFVEGDKRFVAAARAEIARRNGGAAPPTNGTTETSAPKSTAIQKAGPTDIIEGSFIDPGRASHALRAAASKCHLVAPAPTCASLPEGCELAIAMVSIDDSTDTYNVTGNAKSPKADDTVGLGKVALEKIGAAAGITWDPHMTGRLDDGHDGHYCHFRAVGHYRAFDGQILTLTGEVEIDAREGSPLTDEIRIKAQRRKNQYPEGFNDGGDSQILELRKFLLRHAESKAKNRAIASLGIRRSYKRHELDKPFAVAKVMFTGRTNDQAARERFQDKIADSFLSGTSALYGGRKSDGHALPPAGTTEYHMHAAPPVGSVVDDDSYRDDEDDDRTASEPAKQEPKQEAKQEQKQEPKTDTKSEPKQQQQTLSGLPADQDRGADPNKY